MGSKAKSRVSSTFTNFLPISHYTGEEIGWKLCKKKTKKELLRNAKSDLTQLTKSRKNSRNHGKNSLNDKGHNDGDPTTTKITKYKGYKKKIWGKKKKKKKKKKS